MEKIYQLKITLKNIEPEIFRTILIEDDRTFYDFHHILQHTMGWENYHMFQFKAKKQIIADPDMLGDDSILNYEEVMLKQFFKRVGSNVEYEYDFGDGWLHSIKLEKVLQKKPDEIYPICIDGARRCPPEDCGGPWGYEDFVDALTDKKHPEHEDMEEWVGEDFDLEYFNSDEINNLLKKLAGLL